MVKAWNFEVDVIFLAIKATRPFLSHAPWIGGLLGGAFGFYKWWETREKVIFERIEDLKSRDVKRLEYARVMLFETALRPNPGKVSVPSYLDEVPLTLALERTGFANFLSLKSRTKTVDEVLSTAATALLSQRAAQLSTLEEIEKLLSTAHLLRGCIDSAAARSCQDDAKKRVLSQKAIHHFDDSMRLLQADKRLDVLELKGHELCSTGEYKGALDTFAQIEAGARLMGEGRQKCLKVARSLKLQASLHLLQNGRKKHAVELLNLALYELGACAPLTKRDLLDQAQIYELRASAQISMTQWSKAAHSLTEAIDSYDELLRSTESKYRVLPWLRRQMGRETSNDVLSKAARAGLLRLEQERMQLRSRHQNKEGRSTTQSPEKALSTTPNA